MNDLYKDANLTPREISIANELSKGKCYEEIAKILGIKCGTVKNNANHIYMKLGLATGGKGSKSKSRLIALINGELK